MVSLGMVLVVTSIFDTNVKNIKGQEDVMGVTLAVIAVAVLLGSLIWSGWRAYKIEDTLNGVMIETAKTTSLVFIILLGAAMLTAAFRAFGGEDLVRDFLNGLPGGFWSKFVIVMGVIFVLGFFLDFIEIAVVVVPIVAPILLADPSANVTAVWLGVMIGLNIQTSFLTPPFGFALFYLRGVAPPERQDAGDVQGGDPLHRLQLLALGIVGNYPAAGELPAEPGIADLRDSPTAAEPAAAILHGGIRRRAVRRERRHAAPRYRHGTRIWITAICRRVCKRRWPIRVRQGREQHSP